MGISRVQKFKEYRDSLIKEGAPDLKTPKSSAKSNESNKQQNYDTTSTLPMDQVMENISHSDEEQALVKQRRNRLIIKYLLIGLAALVVIALLVVFGIMAFGGNK